MSKINKSKGFPPLGGVRSVTIDLNTLLGGNDEKSHLDADYNSVEPTVLLTLIYSIVEMGGTIQFGRTKNGKAYTIKIYVGKAYDPVYFDGDDAGREAMAALAQSLIETLAGAS